MSVQQSATLAATTTAIDPWQDYRRRRAQFFLAWFGGFAFAAVFMSTLGITGAPDWLNGPICLFVMGAFLTTSIRLSYFRCPWCGEAFFTSGPFHNSFARRCLHCKAAKWTSPAKPTTAR